MVFKCFGLTILQLSWEATRWLLVFLHFKNIELNGETWMNDLIQSQNGYLIHES